MRSVWGAVLTFVSITVLPAKNLDDTVGEAEEDEDVEKRASVGEEDEDVEKRASGVRTVPNVLTITGLYTVSKRISPLSLTPVRSSVMNRALSAPISALTQLTNGHPFHNTHI